MKKVFAIFLGLLLLVSHSYLTIGRHYCGGKVVESKIILGETHLSCRMMEMEKPCNGSENSNEINFDKAPCCKNEYQTVQLTNEFEKVEVPVIFKNVFANVFVYATLNLDLLTNYPHQTYPEYHSPPIEKDIQVLLQTFLI